MTEINWGLPPFEWRQASEDTLALLGVTSQVAGFFNAEIVATPPQESMWGDQLIPVVDAISGEEVIHILTHRHYSAADRVDVTIRL